MQFPRILLLVIAPFVVAGCSDEEPPVRLGLIASLSGQYADIGQNARNGFILAVEEINRTGGIGGRTIELVIRDDATSPETGAAAARELIDAKVEAILGPITSSICKAVRAVTEPEGMLLFSPSAMSDTFTGIDDNFIRLSSLSKDSARNDAEFMIERRGIRRVSMVLDQTNPTFTEPYAEAFKSEFSALGGQDVSEFWGDFNDFVGFDGLVSSIRESKPDAVYLVTGAVDAARLSQQIRKTDATTKIMTTRWAGTPQLIELGGTAVEGIESAHSLDAFSTEERYVRFVEDYKRRFHAEPNAASAQAYEAILVFRKALRNRKENESLKQAILANRPYQGLQQPLRIDDYGDTFRKSYFTVVKDGKYAPAP